MVHIFLNSNTVTPKLKCGHQVCSSRGCKLLFPRQ